MATPLTRWMLLVLLALPLAGIAQEKYPTAEDMDDSKEPPKTKQRARGTADPCTMNCAKETISCAQRCNPPATDPDDPALKDAKKVTKRKQTDSDKCVTKCGQTQSKCVAACK